RRLPVVPGGTGERGGSQLVGGAHRRVLLKTACSKARRDVGHRAALSARQVTIACPGIGKVSDCLRECRCDRSRLLDKIIIISIIYTRPSPTFRTTRRPSQPGAWRKLRALCRQKGRVGADLDKGRHG